MRKLDRYMQLLIPIINAFAAGLALALHNGIVFGLLALGAATGTVMIVERWVDPRD